jgi:hypothetical protein
MVSIQELAETKSAHSAKMEMLTRMSNVVMTEREFNPETKKVVNGSAPLIWKAKFALMVCSQELAEPNQHQSAETLKRRTRLSHVVKTARASKSKMPRQVFGNAQKRNQSNHAVMVMKQEISRIDLSQESALMNLMSSVKMVLLFAKTAKHQLMASVLKVTHCTALIQSGRMVH